MLERIAEYVADESLADWCATARTFQGVATAALTRRVMKVILEAKDVTPGEHNQKWKNGFDEPPPVVALRQKHIMSIDLTSCMIDKIGPGCFCNCESLKTVALPESVVTIGINAFNRCIALEAIVLPKKLVTIQGGAFAFCASLTAVTLPPGVKSIYDSAFWGCKALQSIVLPSSLTTLTDHVFHGCSLLKSVTFTEPASLKKMGGYNWMYNSNLECVELPSSLRKIEGLHTFEGCFQLKSVRLPALVHLEYDTLDCDPDIITQHGPEAPLDPRKAAERQRLLQMFGDSSDPIMANPLDLDYSSDED